MLHRIAALALVGLLALGIACSEPGPAEKAGQAIDDAVEKMKHGDEGSLEKAGRKADEAIDDAKDELEGKG